VHAAEIRTHSLRNRHVLDRALPEASCMWLASRQPPRSGHHPGL